MNVLRSDVQINFFDERIDGDANFKKQRSSFDHFNSYSLKYQQEIKRNICKAIFEQFDKYKVYFVDDMWNIMGYVRDQIGPQKDTTLARDSISKQYWSLPLPKRNEFCRLLTHQCSSENMKVELNEDVLTVLPFLRKRAKELLISDEVGRKVRSDKINLMFIENFMHDFCR